MVVGAVAGAGRDKGEGKVQLSGFLSDLDRSFLGLAQCSRLMLSGEGFYDP